MFYKLQTPSTAHSLLWQYEAIAALTFVTCLDLENVHIFYNGSPL